MIPPALIHRLATTFWTSAGKPEPFPRCLHTAIVRALPLRRIPLPNLRVTAIGSWLHDRRIACPCNVTDRALRACLVARGGYGFLFVDASDPEDEQRFSLAHELAHFLRDYWEPRQRAIARLGETVQDVLDGRRPPTASERLNALLACVPLGVHTHLMHRGEIEDPAVEPAEREADRLAYELLAPAEIVLATGLEHQPLVAELEMKYGLPRIHADAYARMLCPKRWEDPVLRRLRR